MLNVAGADICALAAKQTWRLLDGVPFGLPKLLVPADSGVINTEFIAWSQTSHAERARQAAVPAVLPTGLEDPGGGQSDVAAPVFLAFERYLDVADAADASLATLSIAVIQAFRLSQRLRAAAPRRALRSARHDCPAIRSTRRWRTRRGHQTAESKLLRGSHRPRPDGGADLSDRHMKASSRTTRPMETSQGTSRGFLHEAPRCCAQGQWPCRTLPRDAGRASWGWASPCKRGYVVCRPIPVGCMT